jgi:hypothetical protein
MQVPEDAALLHGRTLRLHVPGGDGCGVPRNRRAVRWPRVESNHRTQLRRLPLYPLSYGALQAEG